MTDSITIDKIPVEVHIGWAQDQVGLEGTKYLQECRAIPSAEITVLKPFYNLHFIELFGVNETVPWAHIQPPLHFFHQAKRFFYTSLFKSIDIGLLQERLSEAFEDLEIDPNSKKMMGSLAECMHNLNQLIIDIRSRMSMCKG